MNCYPQKQLYLCLWEIWFCWEMQEGFYQFLLDFKDKSNLENPDCKNF